MPYWTKHTTVLRFSITGLVLLAGCARQLDPQPGKIQLPPGFSVSVYATGVDGARQMALGANGTLFVGSMNAGSVYAVLDRDQNNQADEVR